MKKIMVIVLSLVLILTSTVAFAAIDIYKKRDKVNYAELAHTGDHSALDGVRVYSKSSLNDRIIWDSETIMGKETETNTKYKFHYQRQNAEIPLHYSGMRTDPSLILQINREDGAEVLEKLYPKGVKYLRGLWEQVENGEEKTFNVKLKDVADFYPFGNASGLPGYSSLDSSLFVSDPESFREECDLILRLQEEFKIPVLEEETIRYSLSKHEDGGEGAMGVGGGDYNFESFPFYTFNLTTEKDIFFAFDAHTSKGNLVDLSYLKHGYGIYRIPYTESLGIDIDKLELLVPLDPQNKIYNLASDGENLLLTYEKEGKTNIDVINIEKAESVQKIPLLEEEVSWIEVEASNGFAVYNIYLKSATDEWNIDLDKIGVLSKEKDSYKLKFIVNKFTPEIQNMKIWYGIPTYAFDGERLILAGNIREEYLKPDNQTYKTYNSPDFGIIVYDKTGAKFAGKYKSSLTTGFTKENEYEYQVHNFYPGLSVEIK